MIIIKAQNTAPIAEKTFFSPFSIPNAPLTDRVILYVFVYQPHDIIKVTIWQQILSLFAEMTKIFVCFHREHKFYIRIYPQNIYYYMPYEQMSEQKLQFVTFILNTLSKTFNLTYIPTKNYRVEHRSPVKATIPLRYPYQLIALPKRKDRKLKFVFHLHKNSPILHEKILKSHLK